MNTKIFWGILAFLPLGIVVYVATGISINSDFVPPYAYPGTFWGDWWWGIIGGSAYFITILFLVHALMNIRMPREKRVLWLSTIVLGSLWVTPFYWWHYIRDEA